MLTIHITYNPILSTILHVIDIHQANFMNNIVIYCFEMCFQVLKLNKSTTVFVIHSINILNHETIKCKKLQTNETYINNNIDSLSRYMHRTTYTKIWEFFRQI